LTGTSGSASGTHHKESQTSPSAVDESQVSPVKIERYDIRVAFHPEAGSLRAVAMLTLRAAEPVSGVTLMLSPQLRISQITDRNGNVLTFVRSTENGSPRLQVTLPEETSGDFTVRINYSGTISRDSLDYVTAEGILLRDESGWYPSPDLTAFAQHRIHMVVPAGWTAAAGGLRTSIEVHDRTIYDFTTVQPVYSRAIAATPEKVEITQPSSAIDPSSDTDAAPAIRVCLPDSAAASAKQAALLAASAFAQYTKLLGPAPLSEYTILPGFPGSHFQMGFSGPGFLVMDEDDLKHFGRDGYSPYFLPHEIAHQWFPQQVAHASEEDGWLAESLGQYLALRYLEAQNPGEARRMVTLAMRDGLASDRLEPISLGLKLFAMGNEITQETLYERGMLVWRTLESAIGRDQVDRALAEYLKRYAGRSATIADFQEICEEISGRDLGWFFYYYIDGTEVPEISVRRTPSLTPGEVSGEIMVYGAPSAFTVRIEVRVSTSTGPITQPVATRGPATAFTVVVPAPATQIEIDPDQRILRWTEPARRNLAQRALMAQARGALYDYDFARAEELCNQTLQADPENLAGNEQEIRFELGLLLFHAKKLAAAFDELGKALRLASLDTRASDAYYAWAHVYRARIAFQRNDAATGRAEAEAGLAVDSPALETEVTQSSRFSGTTTAGKELRRFLAPPANAAQYR
jgi:tetratricopeptide (TPR) repeat protein